MTDDINNSNDNSDRHHQHYPSESSPSLTDPNYLLNQGSNLDTLRRNRNKRTTTTISVYQKDSCCR